MNSLQNKQRLPQGWHFARFDEILKRVERKVILDDSTFYDCVGVRWYGLGVFVREKLLGMDITRKQQWIIKAGDIVYNKLFAWKGAFAIADGSVDGCIVSDKFPTYEADSAIIDPQFLHYYFRTAGLAQQAQDLSKGAAAISKLTLNPPQFWDLTIPLPPIEEQRCIVARIEELAAKIEEARTLRREAVEEAEELMGLTISACFEKGVENGWVVGQLGDYVISDYYGTSEKTTDDDSGIPILRMGNIQHGRIDLSDLKFLHLSEREKTKLLLTYGDILVNRTNSAELVGKCAVFDLEGEYGFASYLIRLRLDTSRVEPMLIAAYINSPAGRAYMFNERKQMTGQANVNATKLKALPIALPSLSMQQRIVAYLDNLHAKVDSLKQLQSETSAELDALLPSILDQAFKGEL